MIRLFLWLMLGLLTAHAEDVLLLNTHIHMIPKIMALDTQVLSHSTSSGTPVLGIVYDGSRKNAAKQLADGFNIHHKGKVGTLSFLAVPLSVDELMARHDIAFVYLMSVDKPSVSKVAAWGLSNSVPTFSYDLSDLEYGILGSIAIERSTIIYLNKNTLKAGKFRFNDALLQIARLIE